MARNLLDRMQQRSRSADGWHGDGIHGAHPYCDHGGNAYADTLAERKPITKSVSIAKPITLN